MYNNYYPVNAPMEDTYSFHVAGITYHDKELKKVINSLLEDGQLEKYQGFTNKDLIDFNMSDLSIYEDQLLNGVQIESYMYDGMEAFKVSIADAKGNYYEIGNVPRHDIRSVKQLLNNMQSIIKVEYEIVGGKRKNVEYDDKPYVEEETLNYGVIVYIHFMLYYQ